MKKNFNYLLIALILIGLPIFAWYYLDQGTRMRKDAMSDLEPKAEIGNFQSVTDSDSLFHSTSLLGKKWIVGIIGADSLRDKNLKILKDLYNQSRSEFSVHVFSIIGLHSGELIIEMADKLNLPREHDWIKTYMAAKHIYIFSGDAFSIPESHKDKSLIALLDQNGIIRQYYSLHDEKEIRKMARQVPVFLSLKN